MRNRSLQEEIQNIVLPVFVTMIMFILCGVMFDCYYDLNDDMVIKDILAGSYTGKPDGHTYQLLYPLGLVLSKVYLLFRGAPVFGIFLSACFMISFGMIGYRSLSYYKNYKVKMAVAFLEGSLLFSVYLWELVYIQYSVVSGILAATACFWFCTIPNGLEQKEFWKQSLPALILVWLAFLVRSEMLLLMCPFVAVAGLFHWSEEAKKQLEDYVGPQKLGLLKQIVCKNNLLRYLGIVIAMATGMLLFFAVDKLAYKTTEWKNFGEFFEARTKVYDYTWYPSYEEQEEFYKEKGITKEQYQLIDSYNFGLDVSIDAKVLKEIASYGEKQKMLGSIGVRVRNLVWQLIHNMFSVDHSPYNYLVLLSYGLVLGLAVIQKRKDYLWKLGLLAIMRTVSWSYLIWSARVVNRIAHPLYITEFLILLVILVSELYERPLWNIETYYRRGTAIVYALFILMVWPFSCEKVKEEQRVREEILINQNLLDDYCKEHGENYYYLDVYSSVSFMEKMYQKVDNSRKNYDLLGGWVCNSPLQEEARKTYLISDTTEEKQGEEGIVEEIGEKNIQTALLEDNFYFVVEAIGDTSFLTDYYLAKGTEVTLELVDRVGEGENPYLIYKLMENKKK